MLRFQDGKASTERPDLQQGTGQTPQRLTNADAERQARAKGAQAEKEHVAAEGTAIQQRPRDAGTVESEARARWLRLATRRT